jgi:hypothetical protein
MDDPEEFALVVKALLDGLGGCVEWDDDSACRVRNDPNLRDFTPEFIKREVIRCVRNASASVVQKPEKRERWMDEYRFYYKVILPLPEFRDGVFVELRLVDADPDVPMVLLVNAHPEVKL